MDEDTFLARFDGLTELDRDQVTELARLEVPGDGAPQSAGAEGNTPERWGDHDSLPGAAAVIRNALASDDDHQALATMASGTGGIYRFGPAMSSAILAACQPQRFTVADRRALKTVRQLGLMPPGPARLRLQDWLPYLTACRKLTQTCGLSLRQVDRALWAGASHPPMPEPRNLTYQLSPPPN